MIAIVAAVAANGVIGRNGELPWHLPDDLKHFRELTLGHTLVMGRATFESIVERLGHALPDRRTVVLTRDEHFTYPDVEVIHHPDQMYRGENGTPDTLYVIGGASLYAAMLPLADKLFITEVHTDVGGDTYFPDYNKAEWRETSRVHHPADDRHEYAFDFVEYERV